MRRSAAILLDDMQCAGGTAHSIEDVLRRVPGVSRAYVNPVTEVAYVEYDGDRCTEADLANAARSMGVHPHRPAGDSRSSITLASARNPIADDRHRWRAWLAFAGFVAIAAFLLGTEHRAHVFGVLPFLFILACPLLHMLGHGGRGAHGSHGGQQSSRLPNGTALDEHDHENHSASAARRGGW